MREKGWRLVQFINPSLMFILCKSCSALLKMIFSAFISALRGKLTGYKMLGIIFFVLSSFRETYVMKDLEVAISCVLQLDLVLATIASLENVK